MVKNVLFSHVITDVLCMRVLYTSFVIVFHCVVEIIWLQNFYVLVDKFVNSVIEDDVYKHNEH